MIFTENIERVFPEAEMALESFEEHELLEIEVYDPVTKRGEYRWGIPQSYAYEMYIIFRPNTIIIYGDIGVWVLRQGGIDLAWLRGAIDSPDYLFQKTSRDRLPKYDEDATKKFAEESITELLDDPPDNIEEIKLEVGRVDWSNQEEAYRFFEDELDHNPAYESIIETWKAAGATWPWVGLKLFLERLDDSSSFHCDGCQTSVNKTVVGFNKVGSCYYCNTCKTNREDKSRLVD